MPRAPARRRPAWRMLCARVNAFFLCRCRVLKPGLELVLHRVNFAIGFFSPCAPILTLHLLQNTALPVLLTSIEPRASCITSAVIPPSAYSCACNIYALTLRHRQGRRRGRSHGRHLRQHKTKSVYASCLCHAERESIASCITCCFSIQC